MLTATVLIPLPVSLAVPQMSPMAGVPHPVAQPVGLKLPAFGKNRAALVVVASTVQVREVATPTLPARSTARTEKLCEPSARVVYRFGLEHDAHVALSRLHSKP